MKVVLIADHGLMTIGTMENELRKHYNLQMVSEIHQAQEFIEFGGLDAAIIRYNLPMGPGPVKNNVRDAIGLALMTRDVYPDMPIAMTTRNSDIAKYGDKRLEDCGKIIPVFYRLTEELATKYIIKELGTE